MSAIETTDGDLYSTTGAVLRASVAVENAPYALMGSQNGSVAEFASCAPSMDQEGSVTAAAGCGQKVHRDPATVAAFASCGQKIQRDPATVAAVASCGDF